MVFTLPNVVDNEEGWGPCSVPEQYKDIPYAPFSKSDKLGKASDWMNSGYSKFNNRYGVRDSGVTTVFNFFANEEEDTFHLVDNRSISRPKFGRRFQQRPNFRRQEQALGRDSGAGADRERQRRERQQAKKNQWNFWHNNRDRNNVQYTSSVDIRPEWTVLEQIALTALTKLSYDVKGEPTELKTCGQLQYYDKAFDRIGAKQEVPLRRFKKRTFHQVTTSSDPMIQQIVQQSGDGVCVYATDQILSVLMCAPRSVYGWDIVVERKGKNLFLDKRERSKFDLLTVHETAQEPIPDEKDNLNGVPCLSQEATVINQNFSQQVLVQGGQKYDFGEKNPFLSGEETEVAPVAYRYRKWKLSEDMSLVARCELHCALDYKGSQMLCTVKALNEFDPKVTGIDWRQKRETQPGAVIATELKNNANKMAKWTAQALLAGADQIKIGYVTRVHPRDNYNHAILGTQFYKPKDFAAQINLNINNMWGILKSIVDICMALDEGKYLLVKDANKPLIRLYEVPTDAFDEDEFEDEAMPAMEETAPEVKEVKKEKDEDDV